MQIGEYASLILAKVSVPVVIAGAEIASFISAGLKFSTGKGIIGSDGSPALTLDADGVMNASENIVMADGKGIDFSAFTDGSVAGAATSQLLNDFEEGTWVPAIAGATWNVHTAKYTKIGNAVTLYLYLTGLTGSFPADGFLITGLPYTPITLNVSCQMAFMDASDSYSCLNGWGLIDTNGITSYLNGLVLDTNDRCILGVTYFI